LENLAESVKERLRLRLRRRRGSGWVMGTGCWIIIELKTTNYKPQ